MDYLLLLIIFLGFRYSASSIPSISSAGVAIGVGSIPSIIILLFGRIYKHKIKNQIDIDIRQLEIV